jgi:cytochrome c oxidase cbb3-type subunit 4
VTYETVATFAQQGGTLFFMALFLAGVVYALLPAKKAEFDRAARMPLDGDDD